MSKLRLILIAALAAILPLALVSQCSLPQAAAATIFVKGPVVHAAPGGGGITLIASEGAATPDTFDVTTAAIDTTGATLLVIVTAENDAVTATTISDSKGNTWTQLASSGGSPRSRIFYSIPSSVGSGHTASSNNADAGAPLQSIAFLAFSGTAASGVADHSDTDAGGDPITSLQPGSVTPSTNGQVIIQTLGKFLGTEALPSINDGYTVAEDVPSAAGNNFGLTVAYKVQTTAAATNPTWTFNSGRATTATGTFKAL